MRSKIAQRILGSTPQSTKDKVSSYAKLLLSDVSGMLPLCNHEYEVKDQYWSSCKHCGTIKPNGNYH